MVHYYRQFIILSKPLLDSQRLTPGARNKFFWRGFHKSDRAEMHTRLIAEHPRQPTDVYFGYLDVFEVARAILGSHDLDTSTESDDSLDEPRGTRSRRSNRIPERRYNQDSRGADPTHRTRKQRCSPSPVERDSHLQCSADRHATPAAYETRVIHLKEPSREEEEREAEDLVKHMRGLSVHEEAYAMLYTRCTLRFPSIVQLLPKPLLTQPTRPPAPAASFSMQVPTPPSSTQHPWPITSIPQSPPQVASNPTSFFRTRARSDGCAFCSQTSHRVRECPSAQEYVRTGRALILEDRLSLPNGQQIPNDGTGCRLKHGIDTWLTAQAQVNSTPIQQVSLTHDTPPHLPTKRDSRVPSAHIEEVTEAHIVQIIDDDDHSDSDDEDPIDFFQVFATERKKRESRRSKLPEFQSPTPPAKSTSPASDTSPSAPVPPVVFSGPPLATPPTPASLSTPA